MYSVVKTEVEEIQKIVNEYFDKNLPEENYNQKNENDLPF